MKVYFVSLGCDKNLVDSEHMLGRISEKYEITVTTDHVCMIYNEDHFFENKSAKDAVLDELSSINLDNFKTVFLF